MSDKPPKLVPPSDHQHFSCVGCGRCCRGFFNVVVTPEEQQRIVDQGWLDEPEYAGVELFQQEGRHTFLQHRDDGSCIFLQDDGLCAIHARFGEPAKPVACRLYPFVLVPAGNETRVDMRYDCPTVAANGGRPAPEHASDLNELVPLVMPADVASLEPAPLLPALTLDWRSLRRINSVLEQVICDISLDLTRRIVAAINLAALFDNRRLAELEGRELSALGEVMRAKVVDAALADPLERVPPQGITLVLFRQIAAIYGRVDKLGELPPWHQRLRTALRMVRGKGNLPPLHPGFPEVPFAALQAPLGELDPEVTQALTRFYRVKIGSLGFFGRPCYGWNYLDGLTALLLTYPLALWFARAYAHGAGRETPAKPDIEAALQVIGRQHGVNPMLDLGSERLRIRQLCDRAVLRQLAIWYGT